MTQNWRQPKYYISTREAEVLANLHFKLSNLKKEIDGLLEDLSKVKTTINQEVRRELDGY